MRQPNAVKPKGPRRRVSEQVVQSLAITSQMALLYPPGIDEWMRRELGCQNGTGRRGTNGTR
jgi:hypothetical protein